MDDPGQRLKRVRERLNLRYRDVEDASMRIAERRKSDEFVVALSRLSDIENKGTVPSLYRLYSLCAIYRLDLLEVMNWYGVSGGDLPADSSALGLQKTSLFNFPGSEGDVRIPLSFDPGLDLSKTVFLSRMIKKWGSVPLMLLNRIDLKSLQYALVGDDDWFMFPIIPPGSLLVIDNSRRRIVPPQTFAEFERPIYFLEHRHGFRCGWCSLDENRLYVQPHPSSPCVPEVYKYPEEVEVIGLVTQVAHSLQTSKFGLLESNK